MHALSAGMQVFHEHSNMKWAGMRTCIRVRPKDMVILKFLWTNHALPIDKYHAHPIDPIDTLL